MYGSAGIQLRCVSHHRRWVLHVFRSVVCLLGNPEWADLPLGMQSAQPLVHLFAEQVSQQVVLNAPSVIQETSGSLYGLLNWTDLSISGMPEGLSFEDLPASIDADNQLCLTYSGIPVDMGEFEVSVSGELFLSVFGSPYSIGSYTVPFMITVVENPNPIPGCTYPSQPTTLRSPLWRMGHVISRVARIRRRSITKCSPPSTMALVTTQYASQTAPQIWMATTRARLTCCSFWRRSGLSVWTNN